MWALQGLARLGLATAHQLALWRSGQTGEPLGVALAAARRRLRRHVGTGLVAPLTVGLPVLRSRRRGRPRRGESRPSFTTVMAYGLTARGWRCLARSPRPGIRCGNEWHHLALVEAALRWAQRAGGWVHRIEWDEELGAARRSEWSGAGSRPDGLVTIALPTGRGRIRPFEVLSPHYRPTQIRAKVRLPTRTVLVATDPDTVHRTEQIIGRQPWLVPFPSDCGLTSVSESLAGPDARMAPRSGGAIS
jgi:hypothetical protein